MGSSLNVVGMSAADGFRIEAVSSTKSIIAAYARVKDFNGDGFDDLVTSSYTS
jgi:hypothetical protein